MYIFMKKIIAELQENTHSWPFVEPVAGVADYYNIIKNPMGYFSVGLSLDLRTLDENVESNKYISVNEFGNDVDLIWINCRIYNQDGSTYVKWFADP